MVVDMRRRGAGAAAVRSACAARPTGVTRRCLSSSGEVLWQNPPEEGACLIEMKSESPGRTHQKKRVVVQRQEVSVCGKERIAGSV